MKNGGWGSLSAYRPGAHGGRHAGIPVAYQAGLRNASTRKSIRSAVTAERSQQDAGPHQDCQQQA